MKHIQSDALQKHREECGDHFCKICRDETNRKINNLFKMTFIESLLMQIRSFYCSIKNMFR